MKIVIASIMMIGMSQQVKLYESKQSKKDDYLPPLTKKDDRPKEEEPCRYPDFCYVPEVEFNEDHPPKEVVGSPYSQKELKDKAKKDFWIDNAKSDTPMPNDIVYE